MASKRRNVRLCVTGNVCQLACWKEWFELRTLCFRQHARCVQSACMAERLASETMNLNAVGQMDGDELRPLRVDHQSASRCDEKPCGLKMAYGLAGVIQKSTFLAI